MSLRLEMLQVARLAPKLLHEASDRVAAWIDDQGNDDGGFPDRAGNTDLYYTVFGLEGLIALQQPPDAPATAAYLRAFGDGEGLDFVHLACLGRCWAALRCEGLPAADRRRILERLESFRSRDGGYAAEPEAEHGTAYHCFLALGAYQDLGRTQQPTPRGGSGSRLDPSSIQNQGPRPNQAPRAEAPDAGGILRCLEGLRSADGAYANRHGTASGTTTATAAAEALCRHLGAEPAPGLADWLLHRLHADGGFVAAPEVPMPDLLSTATALHALSGLGAFPDAIREPCLDFVDSLWTGHAFCGHWADDAADVEYTYYGLLALGHLAT